MPNHSVNLGVLSKVEDNRGLTPYADTTLSRVQMIIDLNNPSASRAIVSPTCLLGHIGCFGPLSGEYNTMQVTYTSNGHYSVAYHFTNAYGPIVDGAVNLPVTPAIEGFIEFQLNSEGWAELVGPWSHSAFPDIAMWHFRYGRHNRRLIAEDQETSFVDFMLGKFHDTYTRQLIN